MLLKICATENSRKLYLVSVKSFENFCDKVKQILKIDGDFRCVLEEDGTELLKEVMEAVITDKEKIGHILILKQDEEWSPAANSASQLPRSADSMNPPLPSLQEHVPSPTARSQLSQYSTTSATTSDIRTLLEKHAKGQRILDELAKYNTLCSESRQTLVKICVAHLVEECSPYPTKEQKEKMASAIVTSFPGLKAASGTGYDHFFSESNGQTGYIQERLKRVRRSLEPATHQRPRKTQPKPAAAQRNDIPATCNLPGGDLEAVDTNKGDITTLRMQCYYANPVTDRAVILSGMAKTAAARQHWIRTNCPSITEVLEQYPRFEDVPLDLLEIDFRLHFPEAVGRFLDDFGSLTRAVIGVARISRKAE